MQRFISPEDGFRIEKAIHFLISKYTESGRNPKPVVLHSLRVGVHLLELGYETDAVVLGILHDLIEDSNTTRDDIKREFGESIATWVEVLSFKPEIVDPINQYQEMFARTINAGRIPIVVKAADLHANSLYIRLVPDLQKQQILLDKIRYFLKMTAFFSTEPVVQHLKNRYDEECVRLEKLKTEKDEK